MTHARYVLGGYAVTLIALAVYAVALLSRLRAATRSLPGEAADDRPDAGQ